MSCRSTRSLELSEERELSDGEEYNSRYRAYGRPQSRRGSLDLSRNLQPPMVRRIGSRQMLVLGDEASIHGNVPIRPSLRLAAEMLIVFHFPAGRVSRI